MGEDRGWPSLHAAAQIATSVTEKFTEKTNKVTSNISGIHPPPLTAHIRASHSKLVPSHKFRHCLFGGGGGWDLVEPWHGEMISSNPLAPFPIIDG